jgi:succinylglutamate desuccinylase
MLADFLQSPVDMVFDFRKNQKERVELESAIRHVVIDLHTETIRKGSPHILRITKTQRAYEKQKIEWLEDEALLKKLSRKIG